MDKETKDKFLNELMKEYYEKIYIFVSRRQWNKNLAADVVQETFLEAYRKADLLIEHPNQIGWLYTTARNKMMKMIDRTKEICSLDDEEAVYLEDPETGDVQYSELELEVTLKSSVSEKEYEMFRDYYVNKFTSSEIADKYGVEESTVRMRMSRLKKKLRNNMSVGWLIFVICIWGLL